MGNFGTCKYVMSENGDIDLNKRKSYNDKNMNINNVFFTIGLKESVYNNLFRNI